MSKKRKEKKERKLKGPRTSSVNMFRVPYTHFCIL
jgi:hypothetical protein